MDFPIRQTVKQQYFSGVSIYLHTYNMVFSMPPLPDEPLAINELSAGGWLPPQRDYTADDLLLAKDVLKKIALHGQDKTVVLPAKVDLRNNCSPVKNQGLLLSCTAFAATGMVEYFERTFFGKYIECSALFLYKVTRKLSGSVGDTGAGLRDVMKALALFGVPEEKFWPYTDRQPCFDEEPGPFVYALAGNYKATSYFCHDIVKANDAPEILNSVKRFIAAGIPSMFGFWKFPCFNLADKQGRIPYPTNTKMAMIAHAVVAVGYDDDMVIDVALPGTQTTVGALLVRNCQGEGWGDNGYGWLPYEYVLNKQAIDFWSLLGMDWVDTSQFLMDGDI